MDLDSNSATARRDAALDMLEHLIGFDTESSKSNLGLIAFVEEYLRSLGVAYVKIPNSMGDKAALFATIGPNLDGGVVLSGHTDVVPVAGQTWTSDPFKLRRDAGRLYGRGACDMKGFDAICLAMIPEFLNARLVRPVHILLSYDEETTCRGPLDTIARFGADLPRPGAVLVGEPTLMQVADAHKSVGGYTTIVHGHAAHSSKPYLGASAVEAACDLVTGLYRFADELAAQAIPLGASILRHPPFTWGQFMAAPRGISWPNFANSIGNSVRCPVSRKILALQHLEDYAAQVVTPKLTRYAADAFVETVTEVEVPGLKPESGSVAESLALKLARSNHTITVPYASEAGQFQLAHVPTVVCGPGSIDQAHQPDEYIDIAQIEMCIAFMRRLATELS